MSIERNTYSKEEKLKSKKAIEQLFKSGKTIKAYPLKAIYISKDVVDNCYLNVGVSVPKRNIKLAVNRNLIKRRVREAYRLNNKDLKQALNANNKGLDVMLVCHSSQILSYQEIEDKIKVILNRLTELSEVVSS
ncbi:MAG: ribonuclease P protein component [Vicingaceae bacterium]|nr:ribonuclease P protein component [Vicingaceae bacterium]